MSKSALIIAANGSEEMEIVITADVLRRAGIEVTIAGLEGKEEIRCSRLVKIVPDKSLDEVYLVDYDIVILPGGLEGSESLAKSEKVKERLERQIKRGAYIGAICAAPCAFKSHGLLLNKRVTSHPCKAEYLKDGYQYSEERVVVDDKLITSRAPGTAFEFAFAIITTLYDETKVDEINKAMFVKK